VKLFPEFVEVLKDTMKSNNCSSGYNYEWKPAGKDTCL